MVYGCDELHERILDAALARMLQVGIRRASLDDIARRSGVSRVTIYRRFTTKENLIDATIAREIQRVLTAVATVAPADGTLDAQIEAMVRYVLRQTQTHPLVTQLLEIAPEEILGFYTVRGEQAVGLGVYYIVEVLEGAQRRGLIGRYDTRPVAELLARLMHSVFLTPTGGVDFRDEATSGAFIAQCVVPMIKHGIPSHALR
ncbi:MULTISPECIES: TetR/AcrR family transcriptional regulator [unclassified Nocardia]|uniref:TetR/AcrR family transcriptional regulator n=1 Tax=unclassified Nocardia TaxID=2637762 RepID=UPI0035DAF5AE